MKLSELKKALLGRGPYPLELRKYLLATGERGLGMSYVERMPAQQFELAWVMMQLVNQVSTKEGREELETELGADIAEKLDNGEVETVDPNKMTPQELEAWARDWQMKHYNQQV